MMHTEGEPAVARVAARAGIPYALHDGHDVHRAPRGGCPRRTAVVPAATCGATGRRAATSSTGPGVGLRGHRAHGRHTDRRSAPARRAQRPDHPAVAVAPDPRRGRCTRLVVRPDDHRAAGVRVAPLRGDRGRARGADVRPGRRRADLCGCAPPGTARSSSRASRPSPTPAPSSTPGPTRWSSPTTADASSTVPPPAGGAAGGGRRRRRPRRGLRRRRDPVRQRRRRRRGVRRARGAGGPAYLYGLMAGGERGVSG